MPAHGTPDPPTAAAGRPMVSLWRRFVHGVERVVRSIGRGMAALGRALWRWLVDLVLVLRFVPFVLYMLLAMLGLWFWGLWAAIGFARFGLRAAMAALLRVSRGVAPRPGPPVSMVEAIRTDVRELWDDRLVVYRRTSRSLARHYIVTRRSLLRFWHWTVPKKSFALLCVAIFIGVPALFVLPRPHEVQIVDNNAIQYSEDGSQVFYVVHAVDIDDPGHTREYVNETAWWLGKINPQGMKNRLQKGKYFRLWVVGLRWFYKPTLFPNIIAATEIDAQGNPVPPSLQASPRAAQAR